MEIPEGHPALPYVLRAEAAFGRRDAAGCDAEGERAARLLADEPRRYGEFAALHTAWLVELRDPPRASARCAAYLDSVAPGAYRTRLLVMRAELLLVSGRPADAARAAAGLRLELLADGGALSTEDEARVLRVEAVTAGEARESARSARLLDASRDEFARAGRPDAAADVERERERLGVRAGEAAALRAVVVRGPQDEISDEFTRGTALKRLCRYEEALAVMTGCTAREDLPPRWRWPVLRETALLLRVLGRDGSADALTGLLHESAAHADRPDAARAELAQLLRPEAAPSDGTFTGDVRRVTGLLAADRPAKDVLKTAERILLGARDRAETEDERAVWHLAAGRLEFLRGTPRSGRKRRGGAGPGAGPGIGPGTAAGPGSGTGPGLGAGAGPRAAARLTQAAAHLETAIRHAENCAHVEIRAQALRLLGHVLYRRRSGDDIARARECWNEARRVDEGVVALQVTDTVRGRMAATVPDATDEWLDAAVAEAAAEGLEDGDAAATVFVAMESARGASVLTEFLPGDAPSPRDLPRPGDHEGARAWVDGIARRLPHARPYAQAVWLMHAGPRHVHHAVLTWERAFLVSVPCRRDELADATARFTGCWASAETLERTVASDDFDRLLSRIARLVGVAELLRRLPEDVRRIAVVAGGKLADVPFAAVETDDGPLGVRYALSDLTSLSEIAPLRRRARRTRGFSRLVVSPRPEGTLPATDPSRTSRRAGPHPATEAADRQRPDHGQQLDRQLPARRLLLERVVDERDGPDALRSALRRPRRRLMLLDRHATPDALRAALARRRYRLVRIYSHGRHDRTDARRSRLRLAPEGDPRGALFTDDLRRMDLSRCGTLVLGACELGAAQHIGADERTGFVRAALVAGAASVVAARWVAPAHVAAALLDRFEFHARHEPRDVALRLAQRDVRSAGSGGCRHAADWACWTLYGDSGFQTRRGPLARRVRGALARRRTSADGRH